MKHLVTFFWALLLMQMVNFVLNSLVGGDSLNLVNQLSWQYCSRFSQQFLLQ